MTAAPQLITPCADLDAAIAHYENLGFRLDMIMPADAPRIALMSHSDLTVRLTFGGAQTPEQNAFIRSLLTDAALRAKLNAGALTLPQGIRLEAIDDHAPPIIPEGTQEFVLTRAADDGWVMGRAGMLYRDLISSRLNGRFIASHIRIPDGGPVADYVHHHNIRFQIIYCRRGWVRLVYEDQGAPFLMREGDCVLQPPHIRHRVLESSPGLEVIEIASPAEHQTWRDHVLVLPTRSIRPDRMFEGQAFIRHVASDAVWQIHGHTTWRYTGIAKATNGLAGVRVLRVVEDATVGPRTHDGEFLFLSLLDGRLNLHGPALGQHKLVADDCCVIPKGALYTIETETACELLEVALPAATSLTDAERRLSNP